MAVRIDLFATSSRDTFVGAETETLVLLAGGGGSVAGASWLGFVAASDADESELVATLDACADDGVLVGAVNQGLGVDRTTASAFAAVPTASTLARTWLDVIGWAAETAEVQQCELAWMTRYDLAGSRDAGAEEWPTSWSDAPTEGTGADSPWPDP